MLKAAHVFHSINRKVSSGNAFKEVRIPVPWGHIAGKWWGPKEKKPILTLHGWQDNCGTYDLLIPSLPKHLSFLALDHPGHGFSSRLPPGYFYFKFADVMMIRRLQAFFGLETVSLMGHSLGATTCYTFAGLYPQAVDFLICIDGLTPMVNENCLDLTRSAIDRYLQYDAQVIKGLAGQAEPPCYTMEAMVEVMYKMGSVDKDKCKYLLARTMKESKLQPGMYYFDRDPRVKAGHLINWPIEDLEEHARCITCPILGTSSGVSPAMANRKVIEKLRNIIVENNPRSEFYEIKESHHGHMNAPELFTEIISRFIEKYNRQNEKYDCKMFKTIVQC